MKKISFLVMVFILLLSTAVAFGGVKLLVKDAKFAIEHGDITATEMVHDVPVTNYYNISEYQISVIEKIGSNYKIAIHKLGTKWQESTNTLYTISEERLNYIGSRARKIVYSFPPRDLKFIEKPEKKK